MLLPGNYTVWAQSVNGEYVASKKRIIEVKKDEITKNIDFVLSKNENYDPNSEIVPCGDEPESISSMKTSKIVLAIFLVFGISALFVGISFYVHHLKFKKYHNRIELTDVGEDPAEG